MQSGRLRLPQDAVLRRIQRCKSPSAQGGHREVPHAAARPRGGFTWTACLRLWKEENILKMRVRQLVSPSAPGCCTQFAQPPDMHELAVICGVCIASFAPCCSVLLQEED